MDELTTGPVSREHFTETQIRDIFRRYGLKLDAYIASYNQFWEAQGARCGVCGKEEPRTKHRRFVMDHCHSSGALRGLLCSPCNTAIGILGDNLTELAGAFRYLAQHEGFLRIAEVMCEAMVQLRLDAARPLRVRKTQRNVKGRGGVPRAVWFLIVPDADRPRGVRYISCRTENAAEAERYRAAFEQKMNWDRAGRLDRAPVNRPKRTGP